MDDAVPSRARRPNPFGEAFALMREKWPVYLAFAVVCGIAGINGSVDIYHVDRVTSLRVILGLALVTLYFVLPAAVRRIDPTFRMTLWRVAIATVMIVTVGVLVDIGYAVAFVPGVIAGVLLSQALLTAVIRPSGGASGGSFVDAVVGGFRESFDLTRHHFVTTLGVLALSLSVVVLPSVAGAIALIVAGYLEPRSLLVTGPLLFLVFVYFECVRYSMIVRWYGRLRGYGADAP